MFLHSHIQFRRIPGNFHRRHSCYSRVFQENCRHGILGHFLKRSAAKVIVVYQSSLSIKMWYGTFSCRHMHTDIEDDKIVLLWVLATILFPNNPTHLWRIHSECYIVCKNSKQLNTCSKMAGHQKTWLCSHCDMLPRRSNQGRIKAVSRLLLTHWEGHGQNQNDRHGLHCVLMDFWYSTLSRKMICRVTWM